MTPEELKDIVNKSKSSDELKYLRVVTLPKMPEIRNKVSWKTSVEFICGCLGGEPRWEYWNRRSDKVEYPRFKGAYD